jgi:short-chain fatty acids transporter
MIERIGERLSGAAERFMPDPFVLVLVLTIASLGAGASCGSEVQALGVGERLAVLARGWAGEVYATGLMKFALQMCVVLITGHALAMSRPVRRGIEALARWAKTPGQAVVLVALGSALASLIQWGLGVIVGAFLAREVGRAFAREGRAVHYPLLGAAGYSGFMVWHGGLSGSAPLKVAEPGHFLADAIGVIPVGQTLFGPLNLAVTGSLLVVIPLALWRLMPRDEAKMVSYPAVLLDEEPVEFERDARAGWLRALEGTRALNVGFALGLGAYLVWFFGEEGAAGWNLDTINLTFLALGLGLHASPRSYVDAVSDGARGCAGILLQFPFYFGILGLLKSSGLIAQIAEVFVAISGPSTFPVLTFLSAGFVNFLVPSGGGQWAVQGPVMMEAVSELSVEPARAIMAMSYGDAWTNMLQPFWALPLLGIMGLSARDIIGYTAFVLAVTGPVIMFWLVVL